MPWSAPRFPARVATMAALGAVGLACHGCFSESTTAGLPCSRDAACGRGQGCVQGCCRVDGYDPASHPDPARADVSILFVIDNSASMGQEQAKIARSAPSLLQALDAAQLSYRIGFTTTDVDNATCQTASENGALVLGSCRERPEALVFGEGTEFEADLRQDCSDLCPLEVLTTDPTFTEMESHRSVPHPWLERVDGETNLGDTSMQDAFTCAAMRGVTGCGLEHPLEAMWLALRGALGEGGAADNAGFISPGAVLAVVFVTDEVDCSAQDPALFADNQILLPDGSMGPPSSVCWRAGVRCAGSGEPFAGCVAADVDAQGNAGVAAGEALLYPLQRYRSLLDQLERSGTHRVLFSLIAGVPFDYEQTSVVRYEVSEDPWVNEYFGIGYGCIHADSAQSIPPVRLLELVEGVPSDVPNVHSICQDDFDGPMARLADRIVAAASIAACERGG